MASPRGVHFCGSIKIPHDPDADIEEILKATSAALPDRLLRLPDGEPGMRKMFVGWQMQVFVETPWIVNEKSLQFAGKGPEDCPPGKSIEDIILGRVRYDEFAIQSYQAFAKLKSEGHISPRTRFQVCLPTPLNPVTFHVKQEYRDHVEIMYQEKLLEALANIQKQIPHSELAIQWDCPIEIWFLEGLILPFAPHFRVTIDSIVGRMATLAASVNEDVQMGFHLCYGDYEHRHAIEPKDTNLMVKLANAFSAKVRRPIDWVHMPVPIDRGDEAYFEPLKNLDSTFHPETELYLGLVHAHDLQRTQERIKTAQKVMPGLKFGVATECGLGRTPEQDISSIFEILKTVSDPVS